MTAPRNVNRCTPCLEGSHRRCTGSAGNIGCGCIHAAPVPVPLPLRPLDPADLPDHNLRLAAARRMAGWKIGDPSWADLLMEAYMDPDTANEDLDAVDAPAVYRW